MPALLNTAAPSIPSYPTSRSYEYPHDVISAGMDVVNNAPFKVICRNYRQVISDSHELNTAN